MTNPKHENPKFTLDDRLNLTRLGDIVIKLYPKDEFLKKFNGAHSPCKIAKICREHPKEVRKLLTGIVNELRASLPDEELLKKIDKCKGDLRKVEGLGSC